MSRVFTVWLDSGANAESCYETQVSLDDIGLTSEAWDAMTEEKQEEVMREIAFEHSDWGFREQGVEE